MVVLLIILGCLFTRGIYEDKASAFRNEVISVFSDLNELSTRLNKYQIKKIGKIDVLANYKGAHGENFPHDFSFKYALKNNKIYFENEDGYNTLTINQDLFSFINGLTAKINVDDVKLFNDSTNLPSAKVNIDSKYLNKLYGTNFKTIEVTVYFGNILSKNIDKTIIKIDNITITKINKNYVINVDDYNIKFNFNKSGYSLNINDNIKMNVFNEVNSDRYTLVVGNYVYSFTLNGESLDFVASTGASIYNSIKVIAHYEDTQLKLEREIDKKDNPITRYFSEVK